MSTATIGLLSSAATAASSFTRSGAGNASHDHLTIFGTMNCSSSAASSSSSSLSLPFSPPKIAYTFTNRRRRRSVSCEVAIKSDSTTSSSSSDLSASSSSLSEEDAAGVAKVGARVRVKVPLKVYHVPKVPEIDLMGKEGEIKQYVAIWKGKQISANLPYKVQFVTEVEGRGAVKFFAHLREDEFEYL
ncbi:ferredoxin-thioredoxin reductase subunit A2, chloroplastic [Cannabis sativa]|uniref:ferredoxin-thioredoxin reductase subunit A2, chloroplastic n=1 Tax=Cannabis sativa TaxID=3483 RepID=UPI0011DFAFFB|nr:ferredoxin-thioredoxin reductase subunit A2, chloroplastic [Cannabis sativa]